jgi:hypothetical protein
LHPIPQDLYEEVVERIFAREAANVFSIHMTAGKDCDRRN